MLTWLASYPKSGSTWVRAFLSAYANYGTEEDEFELEDISKSSRSESRLALFERLLDKPAERISNTEIDLHRFRVQELLARRLEGKQLVVKTHNAYSRNDGSPLVDVGSTKRAVYIVRSPLDIIDSMADHAGISIDASIKLLEDRKHHLGRNKALASQFVGSWSHHTRSWTQHEDFPVLILRYEDMKVSPESTFARLIEFLEWGIDRNRFNWAILNTGFEFLRERETKFGFSEISGVSKSKRFFRYGRTSRWPGILDREQAERVVGIHSGSMEIMGYQIPDLDEYYSE